MKMNTMTYVDVMGLKPRGVKTRRIKNPRGQNPKDSGHRLGNGPGCPLYVIGVLVGV